MFQIQKAIYDYYAERPNQKPPSEADYESLVQKLTEAKKATGIKTHFQYHLLGCYDLLNVSGNTILTKKPHGSRLKPLYVITLKQLPQLLVDAHLETEHGSTVEMQKRLLNYDIPLTVIKLCVQRCQECALKIVSYSPAPIEALSDALLSRIFLLLDHQSHLIVYGVCSRWRNVAELSWNELRSLSLVIRPEEAEFNFNFVKRMPTFFEAVIKRCGSVLLQLSSNYSVHKFPILALPRYATNLQCLRLYELKVSCHNLNFSFAALKCLEELVLIDVKVRGQQHVQLQNLSSSLKRVYCGGEHVYIYEGLDEFCTKTPSLEALYLYNYDERLPDKLKTPVNSLREMGCILDGWNISDSDLSSAASCFLNVEFSVIFQSDMTKKSIVSRFLSRLPLLKILCLCDCHIDIKCLRRIVHHYRKRTKTGESCLQLCIDNKTLRRLDKGELDGLKKTLPKGVRLHEVSASQPQSMAYEYPDDLMTFLGSIPTFNDEQIWAVSTVKSFLSISSMR